jgi:hypothetical protein
MTDDAAEANGPTADEPPARAEPDAVIVEGSTADPVPGDTADDASAGVTTDSAALSDGAERQVIDLVPDELALARAQLDAGLAALAEGTVLRRIAWLEADDAVPGDEIDSARAILAEALWCQQRPIAARAAVEAIRPSSPQRRLPMTQVIEAEALAAAGELDRSAGAMERVIAAVGVDRAWELQAGVPGRLSWPLPGELRPEPPREQRAPWSAAPVAEPEAPPDDERVAAARTRIEEARVAYVAGDLERGDGEMSIALRLDPALAADGVSIMEPTLGRQPGSERLLLYGDLLRAAGRELEANQAYDRAADRRS